MTFARIATTPWLRTPAELHAVAALVGAPHRVLGAVAGPSLVPELTNRLPVPPALAALLRTLNGRLAVNNPCAAARLPRVVGPLARAALRRALGLDATAGGPGSEPADGYAPAASGVGHPGDARDAADARRLRALLDRLPDDARDALAHGGAAWGAAALYEPTTLDVRLPELPMRPTAPEPHPLVARTPYRLVLVVGGGEPPPSWDTLDDAAEQAGGATWPPTEDPIPWFVVRVLVPDVVAARAMDPGTLARWGAMTGRAGAGARDVYWFADTWERFGEPGRRVGFVTPAEIARSRRASPPAAADWSSAAAALTPAAERGVCVPPGYALVDCVGTLELSVVRAS